MKPYGEAFIQEQLYMPQSIRSYPFPTDAYVGDMKRVLLCRERVSFSILLVCYTPFSS